jgi:hypothetical protein
MSTDRWRRRGLTEDEVEEIAIGGPVDEQVSGRPANSSAARGGVLRKRAACYEYDRKQLHEAAREISSAGSCAASVCWSVAFQLWRITRLAGNLSEYSEAMSDERDSLVSGGRDHDDFLELRSYDRSARKADLRVCGQWRGCVSSSPRASIFSTVLSSEKRIPPPSLQCCNFSAKSCLRSPSVHSVSLFLLGSPR